MKNRRWRHPLVAGAFAAALAVASSAGAQSASDKAAAEALFDEGRDLMDQKKYAEACRKFEQSQQIDAGIGTLLYLADCYEQAGRTASAWATFREAASAAAARGQRDRESTANDRASKLEGSLSKVTIAVSESARVEGLTVRRGGKVVAPALYGIAVPVDPGPLEIEVTAPGHVPWKKTVQVGKPSARVEVTVPALEAAPTDEPAAVVPPAARESPAPSASTRPEEDRGVAKLDEDTSQETWGWVLGGVGVVGIGVGSFFGLRAISKNSDAEDFCPGGSTCNDPRGETLTDEAKDAALVSNIAFGIGGAALAAGLVLVLTAPDGQPQSALVVSPTAHGRGGSVGLSGAF